MVLYHIRSTRTLRALASRESKLDTTKIIEQMKQEVLPPMLEALEAKLAAAAAPVIKKITDAAAKETMAVMRERDAFRGLKVDIEDRLKDRESKVSRREGAIAGREADLDLREKDLATDRAAIDRDRDELNGLSLQVMTSSRADGFAQGENAWQRERRQLATDRAEFENERNAFETERKHDETVRTNIWDQLDARLAELMTRTDEAVRREGELEKLADDLAKREAELKQREAELNQHEAELNQHEAAAQKGPRGGNSGSTAPGGGLGSPETTPTRPPAASAAPGEEESPSTSPFPPAESPTRTDGKPQVIVPSPSGGDVHHTLPIASGRPGASVPEIPRPTRAPEIEVGETLVDRCPGKPLMDADGLMIHLEEKHRVESAETDSGGNSAAFTMLPDDFESFTDPDVLKCRRCLAYVTPEEAGAHRHVECRRCSIPVMFLDTDIAGHLQEAHDIS
jgi:hypothetical protein